MYFNSFCCPTNLWPPTVLLLMLLYQWIAMPLLPHQSKTPYSTPVYAIAWLYCNTLGCPTNLWPSTILLFMKLHSCIAIHFLPHQSKTLYSIPFFLLHHCMASCLNISSFVSLLRPIYGPLRYLAKSKKVESDHQSMNPPTTKIWPFMVLSPTQNRGKSTHLWPTKVIGLEQKGKSGPMYETPPIYDPLWYLAQIVRIITNAPK